MGNLGTVTNACGGNFYDSGGPGGQYADNQFFTATFCAPAGQYISFNFTSFNLENNFDFLDVYNGPNTAAPLIGSYTGTLGPGLITSTLGGCITFVFESDFTVPAAGWIASIACSSAPPSTGNDCGSASPFCTGTSYIFPNNTNQPNLGPIDCLGSSPNPVWYYLQIQNPGNLNINISQTDAFGFGIDIDFDLWGPFSNLSAGCAAVAAGTAPSIDCSFSPAFTEQANIVGATASQYYILLLTNYSNQPGTISFSSAAGSTATTNCALLCNITDVTANPGACTPATNTYTVTGQVIVANPPSTGTLLINSSCGGSVTINAPFVSPINYTLPGIIATGGSCNINASFSADPSCSFTQSYTAPPSCTSTILNCPNYASTSTSPNNACAGQVYYFDVANTACNGTISFNVVGNYGSPYGDEITWNVVSNLTGGIVAAGGPGIFNVNTPINTTVGPLNPAILGSIFTLNVFDAFGDGFDPNGSISIVQNGVTIAGPIAGPGLWANNNIIFGANIAISPATITINTPNGPVSSTVGGCNNFNVPLSLQNANFCNTININLPYTITCQSTGAVIASGTKNVTVYPSIPTAASDLVSIDFNSSTCTWIVTPQNDCITANIGNVFTISPNPSSLSPASCTAGNQIFDVSYNGLSGGPNCCSTGGALVPIVYNSSFNQSNVVAGTSPFWSNTNHAAILTIPPYNIGGVANSLTLTININNYCYNQPGPNTPVNTSYWVTIIVNGAIVYDMPTGNPGPVNNSVTINLANLPNGYNQNSNIQVYVYPNTFSSTIYNPLAPCPPTDGRWNAQISAAINANFNNMQPTPAVCVFSPYLSYSCCSSNIVPNAAASVCSGGSLSALTAWQNTVVAANTSCIVYSSVIPVAGSVAPDNLLPNGINLTSGSIVQNVVAYSYCDTDGSGSVNSGDTYTPVSTFDLTVFPAPTATISGTTSICGGTSTVVSFNGTPNATVTYTINGGPNQFITLNAAGGATITTAALTVPTTYSLVSVSIPGPPVCSQSLLGSAVISIIPPPIATFSYLTPVCSNGVNPSPSFLGGGVAGVFTASPAGLNFVNTATGEINLATTTAGTYTITNTIAAAGGCPQVTANFTIVINTAPTLTINPLPISSTLCLGQSTVNLAVTPTSFASYAWSPAAGLSAVTGSSVTANPSVATTYTVIGTAANGCTASSTINVNVVSPSNAGTNASITLCSNDAPIDLFSLLGGTPMNTGVWTGPSVLNGGSSGNFNPAVNLPGIYSYTVPGVAPCPNVSATVTVSVNPPQNATISGASNICSGNGTNIIFNGNPNSIVTYNVNGGASQTITLNALGSAILPTGPLSNTTTYNLQFIQLPGPTCPASLNGSVTITVDPNPLISPIYHD
jgi:hypothetical protein